MNVFSLGADLGIKDNNGKTAMDMAIMKHHSEIVKLLEAKGNKYTYEDHTFPAAKATYFWVMVIWFG